MSANPHTNGGALLRDLRMPDFRTYAVQVPAPGVVVAEATRVQGLFLRDVMKLNRDARNFRIFGPDETASNRFHLVRDVVDRLPQLGASAAYVKQAMHDRRLDHKEYIRAHGEDMPEIRDWQWSA